MPQDRILLDVHAHLVPIRPDLLVAFDGVVWDESLWRLTVDGHDWAVPPLFQPGELIAWMNSNTIETAWISVPPPVYRAELPEDKTAAWVEYLNDGLLAIADDHPDRLQAMIHLPIEHPELAAQIASRHADQGRRKLSCGTGVGGRVQFSSDALVPLWKSLNASSAFLFLHPSRGCDPRLDPFFLNNLVGNPFETGLAAAHLLFSGVLEAYPDITICLAHGGGTTPVIAGRLDRGQTIGATGVASDAPSPSSLMKRFCIDCILHNDQALLLAEHVFGADKVLFGSDWPFPMGLPKPHERLAGIEPKLRRRIICDNPQTMIERFG